MAKRVTISFDTLKNQALAAFREAIEKQHNIDLVNDRINVQVDVESVHLKNGVRFDIGLTGDCAFEGGVTILDDGEIKIKLSSNFRLPSPKPQQLFNDL